jgi:hypothetical protein
LYSEEEDTFVVWWMRRIKKKKQVTGSKFNRSGDLASCVAVWEVWDIRRQINLHRTQETFKFRPFSNNQGLSRPTKWSVLETTYTNLIFPFSMVTESTDKAF